MFDSLHIQGFRPFRDLKLTGLGTVNLLVGKNNIGKTAALEGIKMLCSGAAAMSEVRKLLDIHEEMERDSLEEGESELAWNIGRLFYGESSVTEPPWTRSLSIGPLGAPQSTLGLELVWVREKQNDTGEAALEIVDNLSLFDNAQDLFQAVALSFGEVHRRTIKFERFFRYRRYPVRFADRSVGSVNCHFLPARGFPENEVAVLWDKVVLTDWESVVLDALGIISPGIDRISLIESNRRSPGSRVALVRRSGLQSPEPLKSLGDGMNRIFEMALALVNSRGGVLLVDEVENGIHYSVQQELWSFVFEMAQRLGCQIFATTHSWDCIEAFQRVASSHVAQGALIRLYQHENEIDANTFDEHQLEILTRESIEVR
ncbi:MAG: ATP-binding protein [Pseudomonadota bacterium]